MKSKERALARIVQAVEQMGLTQHGYYGGVINNTLRDEPGIKAMTLEQLHLLGGLIESVAFQLTGCDGTKTYHEQVEVVRQAMQDQNELRRDAARYADDVRRFEARGNKCEHCDHDHKPGTRCPNQHCLCDTTEWKGEDWRRLRESRVS